MSCYPVGVQRRCCVSVSKSNTHSNTRGWGLILIMSATPNFIQLAGFAVISLSHHSSFFMCMCALSQDVRSAFNSTPPDQYGTRSPKLCSDFLFHPAALTQVCPLWRMATMSEQQQTQPTCHNLNCPPSPSSYLVYI